MFSIINKNVKRPQENNKKLYNKKVFGSILLVNDKVLTRNILERGGAGNLTSHWEKETYVVVSSDPDLPVYKIKPEKGSKPIRTVHRNLLSKCNELPFETSSP